MQRSSCINWMMLELIPIPSRAIEMILKAPSLFLSLPPSLSLSPLNKSVAMREIIRYRESRNFSSLLEPKRLLLSDLSAMTRGREKNWIRPSPIQNDPFGSFRGSRGEREGGGHGQSTERPGGQGSKVAFFVKQRRRSENVPRNRCA